MNGGTEMDVREKLVELLDNFHRDLSPFAGNEKLFVVDDNVEQAEYLVEHGVTVQEWVSVEDRLPDSCGFPCLLCGENSFGQIRVFEGFTGYMERGKFEWHSNQKDIDIDVWTITHWMPMPHPPKGE